MIRVLKRWICFVLAVGSLLSILQCKTAYGYEPLQTGENGRTDLDPANHQAVFDFWDSLPQTVEEFTALPQQWWDSLLPYERLYAETEYRYRLQMGDDGPPKALDSLDAYIEEILSGKSEEEVLTGTILEGLTVDDLKVYRDDGYTLQDLIELAGANALYSGEEYGVLTTKWVEQGNGRFNRKYLNGEIAFCFDRQLKFPDGAQYYKATAAEAKLTGRAAYIIQFFGDAGIDYDDWWNSCQCALWAVQDGLTTYEEGAAYAQKYCQERGITEERVLNDYMQNVGNLVVQSIGMDGSCYVYMPYDGSNQRLAVYRPVWKEVEPEPVISPQYAEVTAEAAYEAQRTHTVAVNAKTASLNGETLAGAVFHVHEDGVFKGSITTDALGTGSISWTIAESASASDQKTYCTNYHELLPEVRDQLSCYSSYEEAYEAALLEATQKAQVAADQLADRERTVTVTEVTAPNGFLMTQDSVQTFSLKGNGQKAIAVVNDNQKAAFQIHKVDGMTGMLLSGEAGFILYEWNGTSYEVSPNYEIVRLEDGTYTVSSRYEKGQDGYLYYTGTNEGKFGLAEVQPPQGYVTDPEIWYFQITSEGQMIYGHNRYPETFEIADSHKFANRKTRHLFVKTDEESKALLSGARLQLLKVTGIQSNGSYMTEAVEEWLSDQQEKYYFYEEKGILLQLASPEELPAGKELITKQGHLICGLQIGTQYMVREVTAPQGYVNGESAPKESLFTVTDTPELVIHELKNTPAKGSISITKKGDVLTAWNKVDTDLEKNLFHTEFRYEKRQVKGAAFAVYVGETITTPDGWGTIAVYNGVTLHKDVLVAVISTDQTGTARLEGLPLGQYYVKEVTAGAGDYLLNPMLAKIDLVYQGQDVSVVVHDSTEYVNERQKVELVLAKRSRYASESDQLNSDEIPPADTTDRYLPGAIFGVYNEEDIIGYEIDSGTGSVKLREEALIPAHTLVEKIETDANGMAVITSDLPCGKYYVKELSAPDGYLEHEEIYYFDASYTGQEGETVLRFFHEFYNEPTITEIKKVGADGDEVSGALLQVQTMDGQVIDQWVSDGTSHYIKHLNLDTQYILHEAEAPEGYGTAEDVIFKITQDTDETGNHLQRVTLWVQEMQDGHIHGAKGTVYAPYEYTDGDYTYQPGDTVKAQSVAQWQIIDDILVIEIDAKASKAAVEKALREDLFADVSFQQVYISGGVSNVFRSLQLAEAPRWNTPMPVWVDSDDGIMMENHKIQVQITKTDVTSGKPVTGAVLYVQDEEGNIVDRWETTTEPHHMEGLRPGQYLLVEEKPPVNSYYSKAEPIRFTVHDSRELQTISMMEDVIRISVSKVDAQTWDRLVGAELALLEYSSPGVHGREVATWTSDGSVRIFSGLKPGMYYLQERKAPEGYQLSEGINFTVSDTYVTQEIVLKNRKAPPFTGDTAEVETSLLGIMAGLGGMMVVLRKKKRWKKV